MDDLAGTLTYYFDQQDEVQRITFYGFTGDERKLVELVTGNYNLKQQPSLGGLYLLRWNRRVISALKIKHAPIVNASRAHKRRQLMLELNRPASNQSVSAGFAQILKHEQMNRQWK